MRILQVCVKFHHQVASGSTRIAYNISRELVRRGHSVTVYTSDMKDKYTRIDSGFEKIDGVKVHRFRSVGTVATREMKMFITPSIIQRIRDGIHYFDIIHLHEYTTFQNIIVHYYAKKYKIPYVLQAHGSLPKIGSWRKLKKLYDILWGYRLLHDASKVIALSRVEAEQYRSMGVPEEKIAIIPNGIDLSEYTNLPPKGQFKRKFNIPEDKKIVLYLGRIHKIKGIDFLVEAYAYLAKKMDFKDAVLVIAGPDDGYLNEAKRLVASLNVANETIFTGMLTEKEKVSAYVDSNVVVNVEPRNVFGLVPLEAAACSTPVIVSRGNAISEVIHEGRFGFSVNYGDIAALAKTMETILKDEDFANEMGKRGREYIFANFDWSKIVAKIEELYQEIVTLTVF